MPRQVQFLWPAVLLAAALGCGSAPEPNSRVAVFPVKGQLLVDGHPADGAQITFHPADPAVSSEIRPTARVADDGSFLLSTYDAGDGAPAGEYVVTVEWRKLVVEGEDAHAGPDLIGAPYSSPQTSQVRVKVSEGQNDLEPIKVARQSTRSTTNHRHWE